MRSLLPFLTRNWTLKLSAVGLALLIWFALRVETVERQEVSGIPVQVQLADPDWAMVGDPMPASVDVRFGGPLRELIGVSLDRPQVVIPVSQVFGEDTTVVLRSQWVRIPERPGLVVEDIRPQTVRLSFEAQERVTVPVTPTVTGELPSGFALAANPSTSPDAVRVIGPRSRVEGLESVSLSPVDLSELDGRGTRTVEVDTTGMRGLAITPSSVQVTFPVEERAERTLGGVEIVLDPPEMAAGLEADPSQAGLRITGARSLVETLDPADVRAVVDVSEYFVRLDSLLREAVDDAREEDEEFDQEAYRAMVEEEGILLPVSLEGVPELVEAEPEPDRILVRRPPPS